MSNEDMQILKMWRNKEFNTVICDENNKEYEIYAFIEFVNSDCKGLAVFTEHNMLNILKPVKFDTDGKLHELDVAIGGRLDYLTNKAIQHYNEITIQEGGYISKVHYQDRTDIHYIVD